MSNKNRVGVVAFQALLGLLALGALISEVIARTVQGTFDPLDFCSRFTHQSTLLAAIALLTGSYYTWKGKESAVLDWFRGGATIYSILAGSVYYLLLNNGSPAIWINDHITHGVTPVAMALTWFVLNRPSTEIPYEGHWSASMWLVYPVSFAVYAWIYGTFIRPGDYLYGFLDLADARYALSMVVALTAIVAVAAYGMIRLPTRQPALVS